MSSEKPLIERRYHIPLAMFQEAFRSFQKKYVYPRNIVLSVVLAAVAGVYVKAVVDDPSQKLAYLLIVACAAMILITWYNTFKLRRSVTEALREVENDTYEMKLYPDRMTVLAKDPEGGDYVIEERKPAEAQPETDGDGNGFQQIFPEKPAEDAELLEPTEIRFGKNVKLHEYGSFFMVYIVRQNFYLLPKEAFNAEEQTLIRNTVSR
ncbi:MAG: YcxB family protein [Oscillospiraceae bacterium]|nr:YcxB family protein [Oscillospiraceae bacterium]